MLRKYPKTKTEHTRIDLEYFLSNTHISVNIKSQVLIRVPCSIPILEKNSNTHRRWKFAKDLGISICHKTLGIICRFTFYQTLYSIYYSFVWIFRFICLAFLRICLVERGIIRLVLILKRYLAFKIGFILCIRHQKKSSRGTVYFAAKQTKIISIIRHSWKLGLCEGLRKIYKFLYSGSYLSLLQYYFVEGLMFCIYFTR